MSRIALLLKQLSQFWPFDPDIIVSKNSAADNDAWPLRQCCFSWVKDLSPTYTRSLFDLVWQWDLSCPGAETFKGDTVVAAGSVIDSVNKKIPVVIYEKIVFFPSGLILFISCRSPEFRLHLDLREQQHLPFLPWANVPDWDWDKQHLSSHLPSPSNRRHWNPVLWSA